MKLKQIIVFLIAILLIASIVNAEKMYDSPLPTDFVQNRLSGWTKFKMSLSGLFEPLAVVNGGQCSISPDDAGCVKQVSGYCDYYYLEKFTSGYVYCGKGENDVETPTGCRVCFYDQYHNPIKALGFDSWGCKDMYNDGKVLAPGGAYYWERYNCYESDCIEESEFQNAGCGEWNCDKNQMYRTRKDSCGNVDNECIYWASCQETKCSYSVGDWGECVSGKQSRTVTYAGCNKEIQTQECSSGDNAQILGDIIIEANNEAVSVIDGNVVVGEVDLKNVGTTMIGTYILEMQVVKKGLKPFSFVGSQETCDPEHPENVHRQFRLGAGEEEHLKLYTETTMPVDEYDVYFLMRTKCFKDLSEQEKNDLNAYYRVNPYPYAKNIGSVCVGSNCDDLPSEAGEEGSSVLWTMVIIFGGIIVFFFIMLGMILTLRKGKRGKRR